MLYNVVKNFINLLIIFSFCVGHTFAYSETYNNSTRSTPVKRHFNEENPPSSKQKLKKASKRRKGIEKKSKKHQKKSSRKAAKQYRNLNKRKARAAKLAAKIQKRLQKSLEKSNSKSYAKKKQKLARLSKKFSFIHPEQINISATSLSPRPSIQPKTTVIRDEAQARRELYQARREQERREEEMRQIRLLEERLRQEETERREREQREQEQREREEEQRQEQLERERILQEQQEREQKERELEEQKRLAAEEERLRRQKEVEEQRRIKLEERQRKEREEQERKLEEEEQKRKLEEEKRLAAEEQERKRKLEEEERRKQQQQAIEELEREELIRKQEEELRRKEIEDRKSEISTRSSISSNSSQIPDILGTIGPKGLGRKIKEFSNQRVEYYQHFLSKDFKGSIDSLNLLVMQNNELLGAITKKHQKGEFDTPELAANLLRHLGINLTDVTVKIMKGGFVSGNIIRIQGWSEEHHERLGFFLKYLRNSLLVDAKRCTGEVQNLQRIKNLLHEGKIIEAGFNLVLPLFEGQYEYKGKEKLFTILPAAKGQSLTEIVNKFFGNDAEKVCNIFREIGIALGTFQINNIVEPPESSTATEFFHETTTISHNDWHFDNIFYDDSERASEDTTQRASLIDVETIAYGIDTEDKKSAPLVYDLFYAIQQTHKRIDESALKEMKAKGWQMFKDLIDGYISVFPTNYQGKLTKYLESCMRHSKKEVEFVDIFPKILGRLITWKKSPNDSWSTEIISTLEEHLKIKLSEFKH